MLAVNESSERSARPERTCAGCRRTDDRDALVRLVLGNSPPILAPDVSRKLPGRGVSVHPTRECIEAAASRGGFARTLKTKIDVDARALAGAIAGQYARRIDSLLVAAWRAKKVAIGTEAVRDAMVRGKIAMLVVAEDAAGRREELAQFAERLGRACVVWGNKASLGGLFGRDEVGVLGVVDEGIAAEIHRAAAHVAELSEDG